MPRPTSQLLKFLSAHDVDLFEWYSAHLCMVWGLWGLAIRAGSTFNVLGQQVSTRTLSLLFFAIGVVQLVGLFKRSYLLRSIITLVACSYWCFIGLLLISRPTLHVPMAFLMAIAHGIGFVRMYRRRQEALAVKDVLVPDRA